MNSFGDYPNRPTTDPDAMLTIDDLYNRHNSQPSPSNPTSQSSDLSRASYGPFSSKTLHSIMKWLNNGNTSKSEAETNRFVHDVNLSASFHCEDLVEFDAHRENQRLDKSLKESALQSHFVESSIDILVPSGNISIWPKHFTVCLWWNLHFWCLFGRGWRCSTPFATPFWWCRLQTREDCCCSDVLVRRNRSHWFWHSQSMAHLPNAW